MEICAVNIPLEIIKIILSNVTDNETFTNCRLVCKLFYELCTPLRSFKNNSIYKYFHFREDTITIVDNNNILLEEYVFKKYGDSIYKKYNDRGIIVNTMELRYPKTIVKKTINNNIVHKVEFDLVKDSIKKELINLYGYGGCILS